jgi:hypothetical protein
MAGDDEKIVLLGAVLAHFAEGHIEAIGADPDSFGQDLRQIALAEREAAEPGDGRLLAKQLLDFRGVVGHRVAAKPSKRGDQTRQSIRVGSPNLPIPYLQFKIEAELFGSG